MKRISFAILAAVAALAVPASAVADTNSGRDCNYGKTEEATTGNAAPVVVYVGTGDAGMTGTALVAAGACVDELNVPVPGGTFDGGAAEAGAGIPSGGPGGYVIVDGNDDNTDQTGQSDGYVGLSNYETGTKGNCNEGSGTGTNSGGCFRLRPLGDDADVPLVPIACGNTTGPNWTTAGRDGCVIP